MTQQQFELIKKELKKLSTHQLRILKCEINSELDAESKSAITDEELKLISSLFA
ncbi:hypothetical protein VIOR3934_08701 [Vibrio orientalis CIP 102891 = ATCC 33934]|uniref:Uncharacterized protein n=1 Tax=Vibrio orientalis CIP 102891 = ATCC 33934 TaxID=675816 RepID=C9QFG1_VIBOR|nr:hypothetical protein [Vibrio orientalis]EEX93997.1 hypothetical protein VIA_001155 [Vibrio orientalis CIP 102891 = ATCC 33934]EGU52861.1 hypothetical protein VIOR3934_08701 [Vibrio orientalis CIP 102891 = ATCC 33934]